MGEAKLADASVKTAKLGDSAVTSAKIADGTIVAADIAKNAITEDRLAAAVTAKFRSPVKLWEGKLLMQDGHTATLSQTVASQPHGIVLVFSGYNGSGTALDYYWTCFFVPAALVAAHPGKGHQFFNAAADCAAMMKYIYVANDKLTGYSGNNKNGTASGIAYNNNLWVLRYVYGV